MIKENRITPENITELKDNEIFVFGSNLGNFHGAGAARQALKFGAVYGQGGLQGQTYALPTKDRKIQTLPLYWIDAHIQDYLEFARNNPQFKFLTTAIGCGLAGYSVEDIASLFFKYEIPDNVCLPESFWDWASENWKIKLKK